eukprot:TRINITY_DN1269_c0_g1_i2.p1 TRINITY_DN1269_c0_g1~~TRINITY_DN1269_c0_g1_i2.p1  ORF type:complete len:521 (+),score=137.34 TRINITY_DN1269_c0_g1_i2:393-1955(+)
MLTTLSLTQPTTSSRYSLIRQRKQLLKRRHITASVTDQANTKPFSEIPQVKGTPILKGIKAASSMNSIDALEYDKVYGDMVRFNIFSKQFVGLFSPEAVKDFIAYEPAMPDGIAASGWSIKYRNDVVLKKINRDSGISSSGLVWKKARDHFQAHMFPPKESQFYFPHIDRSAKAIVGEFEHMKPEDLPDALMKTAFELFHGFMFGKPAGIFKDDVDPNYLTLLYSSKEWISAIALSLRYQEWMKFLPKVKKLLNTIEVHTLKASHAWDVLGEYRIKDMIETKDELQNSSYIAKLGAQSDDLRDAVYKTGDFLSAAVDTTSTALIWLLYHTASNPEKQELLYQQIKQELNGEGLQSQEDADRVPLLNGFIKESQRLNPVGGGTIRTYPQDVIVKGYTIPAGTTVFVSPSYVSGRNPEIFENPREFIPERWLPEVKSARRKAKKAFPHDSPFTFMQFSIGPRMCLGARIAHVELLCILARLVEKYQISFVEGSTIPTMDKINSENGLGIPTPYPQLKFTPRE